jgi:hypothetical protein
MKKPGAIGRASQFETAPSLSSDVLPLAAAKHDQPAGKQREATGG